MVTLLLDSERFEVVLSPTERALALRRSNVTVARSSIERVMLTADPWTWLRGIRSPGIEVPGVLAMGTWKTPASTDFAVVRRRGRGVVIELAGEDFQRIILTTRHGIDLVKALRLDAGEEPTDVVDLATGTIPQVG